MRVGGFGVDVHGHEGMRVQELFEGLGMTLNVVDNGEVELVDLIADDFNNFGSDLLLILVLKLLNLLKLPLEFFLQ